MAKRAIMKIKKDQQEFLKEIERKKSEERKRETEETKKLSLERENQLKKEKELKIKEIKEREQLKILQKKKHEKDVKETEEKIKKILEKGGVLSTRESIPVDKKKPAPIQKKPNKNPPRLYRKIEKKFKFQSANKLKKKMNAYKEKVKKSHQPIRKEDFEKWEKKIEELRNKRQKKIQQQAKILIKKYTHSNAIKKVLLEDRKQKFNKKYNLMKAKKMKKAKEEFMENLGEKVILKPNDEKNQELKMKIDKLKNPKKYIKRIGHEMDDMKIFEREEDPCFDIPSVREIGNQYMIFSKKKSSKKALGLKPSSEPQSHHEAVNKYGEKPEYLDYLPQIKQKMKLTDKSNEKWKTKSSLSDLRSEIERMDEKVGLKEYNLKRFGLKGKMNLERIAEYGEDLNNLYLNSIDAKIAALKNKKGLSLHN